MSARPPADLRDAAAPRGDGAGANPLRAGLFAAAAALVVAGFFVRTTPNAGGGRSLEAWWTCEAGVVLAVAAWGVGRPTARAARFAALFLLAAAAQISLTTPLWLQYLDLRPSRLAAGTGPVAAAALALQAAVVAIAVLPRAKSVVAAVRSSVGLRARLLLALLFVLTAAHASPLFGPGSSGHLASYAALLVAVAGLLVLNVANLWLFVDALPADAAERWRERVRRFCSLPGEDRAPTAADAWIPRVLAVFVLAASALLATAAFDRVAHIPDDGVYLFHAQCAAAGRIAAPVPPVPEAFGSYLLDVRDGRWFATTNPGWPDVLAIGVAAGAPWLVNPVLGAIAVLLLHAAVRRWTDRGTAHVVTLLCAASPWFLFLSASFMTHLVTLVLLLGAWLLALPREGPPRPLAAGLAGALLGCMVIVRPMDGLIAGAFTGVWLLARERRSWPALVTYALGCVAGAIGLFVYNSALTGNPLREPMSVYLDELWYPGANRLGFGADVGNVPGRWGGLDPLPGHGPLDVLLNLNQNLYNLNVELFGWTAGSLALVVVHALFGRWTSLDKRMAWLAALVPATYSCYWFSGGPDFGPRYWFLVLVPCLWLSARGAATLAGAAAAKWGAPGAAPRAAASVALLAFASLAVFVPWRATARYVDYRGFHADFRRLAESGRLGRSLVLVRATTDADMLSALYLNPPTLDPAGPLFARDLGGDAERRLRAAYPDRPVVRVDGRSVTGTTARIVEEAK